MSSDWLDYLSTLMYHILSNDKLLLILPTMSVTYPDITTLYFTLGWVISQLGDTTTPDHKGQDQYRKWNLFTSNSKKPKLGGHLINLPVSGIGVSLEKLCNLQCGLSKLQMKNWTNLTPPWIIGIECKVDLAGWYHGELYVCN